MGVGRCGRSSAPGGRVTHVDIVCGIFGCGILEADHGRLESPILERYQVFQ
jgi:hypothetical protein